MVTYEYLKFLNLQWWYCVIYSLFGGKCTYVDEFGNVIPDGSVGGSGTTTIPVSSNTGDIGFWEWLFGTGGVGAGAGGGGAEHAGFFSGILTALAPVLAVLGFLWALFSVISYTISGILMLVIAGSLVGLIMIRYEELAMYGTLPPRTVSNTGLRSRWQLLLDQAISTDPKAWRAAILQADVMLGELLLKLGYQGSTTAERLRSVPENAFVTYPNAWEAHRIRNFVSARSSDYILTQREAFRVMKLYEQVFEEFDFI